MKIGVVLVGYHSNEETIAIARKYRNFESISEIVIVNNDSRQEECRELEELPKEGINVILEKENLGYSKGNNIGIRWLLDRGCKEIIVSNSDVIVTEETVLTLAQKLEERNEYGALAPVMLNIDKDPVPLRYGKLDFHRVLFRIFLSETSLDRKNQNRIAITDGIAEQSFLPGSFFMVKAEAIVEADFFDENIFLYREEEILGERLRNVGYSEGVLMETKFIHNHPYKSEPVAKRMKQLKCALQSEKYYFTTYLKVNGIQSIWLDFLQKSLVASRYLIWNIQSL